MKLFRLVCGIAVVFVLIFSCIPVEAAAQQTLKVPVKFKIVDGDLVNAMVIMENRDGFTETFPAEKNMSLALLFNENYLITFVKPGFVTKKIAFNTEVPADRLEHGFSSYPIGVKLFKQYDNINLVVFNQPVAKIQFSTLIDDFDFDVDYTKSIQSVLAKAENELEAKAKEEEMMNAQKEQQAQNTVVAVEPAPSKSTDTGSQTGAQKKVVRGSDDEESAAAEDKYIRTTSGRSSASGEDRRITASGFQGSDRPSAPAVVRGDDVKSLDESVAFGYDQKMALSEVVGFKEYLLKEVREDRRTVYYLTVEQAERSTVYKKVVWDWGGIYYFVNEHTPVTGDFFNVYPYMNQ